MNWKTILNTLSKNMDYKSVQSLTKQAFGDIMNTINYARVEDSK